MRVLFDYQGLIRQKYGGISLYYSQLISHFPPEVIPVLGLRVTQNLYVGTWPRVVSLPKIFQSDFPLPSYIKSWRIYRSLGYRYMQAVNKRFFKKLLAKGEFDLFHVTYDWEDWWLPFLQGKPFIYTVHDLIPEVFGTNAKYLETRKHLAENASRIIAVSENSKNDCMRLWGVPENKIKVIYHAPSIQEGDSAGKPVIEGDYILYVGGRRKYKNFEWFVTTLSPLLKARKHVKLICTGDCFSSGERSLLKKLGLSQYVSASFFDQRSMFDLYRYAKMFIYPSRYEGFGMPILDAFKAGCPVILSNNSCFPEVASNAALYFELNDSESLIRLVVRVLDNVELRQKMIDQGFKRVSGFSWTQAALDTYRVYQQALQE